MKAEVSATAYRQILFDRYRQTPKCVSAERIGHWMQQMLGVIFPVSKDNLFAGKEDFEKHLEELEYELEEMVLCSLSRQHERAIELTQDFFKGLPGIIEALDSDIDAIYQGDPAAQSLDEVVRSYPAIQAIAAYRMAHYLDELEIPIIPRLITEHAHSKTGIDIHPAAQIGKSFFIDHGTGIVIGATAVIGDRVKIYQGVTLGGLSVRKCDARAKRHPTIEDDVIIYAGATILGGKTVIGNGSVIGGNTFITKSIPAQSKIHHSSALPQK